MFKRKTLLVSLFGLALSSPVLAHDGEHHGTGADAMVQHIEASEDIVMQLVMPHSHAEGNQMLINFFTVEEGTTALPESVTVAFSAAGSDEISEPVALEHNGPVYSAAASGVTEPGEWLLHFDIAIDAMNQTEFTVPVEFF